MSRSTPNAAGPSPPLKNWMRRRAPARSAACCRASGSRQRRCDTRNNSSNTRQNRSMPLMRRLTCVIAALLLALPAAAWNYSGHCIVAEIAYERLTPQARARVDQMIRNHPDYSRIFTQGATDATKADPAALARYAFVHAAPWPDMIIYGDDRFYDELAPNAQPTPLLPGFPDMMRHRAWHYFDTPFSGDGTPVIEQQPPHLM